MLNFIKSKEHYFYWAFIIALNLIYLFSASTNIDKSFGFNQLHRLEPSFLIIMYSVAIVSIFIIHQRKSINPISFENHYLSNLSIAIFGLVIFWSFRTNFVNADGQNFIKSFVDIIPEKGYYATHDEMLEFYVHSRFYYWTNLVWGWSVKHSFQVLSCASGAAFLLVLLALSKQLAPKNMIAFIGLIVSAGFMQLFFGDVENYSMVSVFILLYFLFAIKYIKGDVRVIVPSCILCIAMGFHLLSGWLLPSLSYLFIVAAKRSQKKDIAFSVFYMGIIFGSILLFFHFKGLPIRNLYYHSHALGHGGKVSNMLSVGRAPLSYYIDMTNLLFLLYPLAGLVVLMALLGRIKRDEINVFLIRATVLMIAFMYVWTAGLGVYNDWNLFAPSVIPLAIFGSRNFVQIENLRHKEAISLALVFTAMIHSATWIIYNHSL